MWNIWWSSPNIALAPNWSTSSQMLHCSAAVLSGTDRQMCLSNCCVLPRGHCAVDGQRLLGYPLTWCQQRCDDFVAFQCLAVVLCSFGVRECSSWFGISIRKGHYHWKKIRESSKMGIRTIPAKKLLAKWLAYWFLSIRVFFLAVLLFGNCSWQREVTSELSAA